MYSSSNSDLKKSTAVDESLPKTLTRCSVPQNTNQLQDRVTCFISALVLDRCTEPHPIYGADGICLCSCSGMDYCPLYIYDFFYGSNELKNTYFQFKGGHYEQTEGAAMGSPISPINLFMEDLEVQAIMASPSTPLLWKRFVDDTSTTIKKQHKNSFLEHLNSINPSIKFSSEETITDGSMPFLDILITPRMMAASRLQCRENPHTLTYIYSGTATTQFHQNTVWWEHCISEQNPSAQTKMFCTRKTNILSKD